MHEFIFGNLYQQFTRASGEGKGFMALVRRSVSRLETPDAPLPVTRIGNTKVFFSIMAGMVTVSVMVLFLEMMEPKFLFRFKKNIVSFLRFCRHRLSRRHTRKLFIKVAPIVACRLTVERTSTVDHFDL